MSELIFTWLNDEVQLSKKITSFEKDFGNGYFFGELLSKYNQQLNFREFKNLDSRDIKIRNFNLLKPTFDTLKVKFDPCIVKDIMAFKKDVAPHLLYQLKMALEKVNNPADVISSNKAGKYNTVIPLMKINPPIEQYAKMDAKFFDERLCAQNRPQKAIDLETHLEKFATFKVQQDTIIKKQIIMADEREKSVKEQMRKIELNKLQRNMAFQEDWNEKGLEEWKKNQEITKKRVNADKAFQTKVFNKEESKRLNVKEQLTNETNRDVEHFEENLHKKGLGIPEEDENGNVQKKEHKHTVSANATMKRIKEKSQVNEFLSKERDKRRRKMIVDQAKLQRDIQVRKREEFVLKKLEQQSRQEKEIEYEVWRGYQCKQIIINNRHLRDEKYKQKNEVNVVNAKYKEEELLKILRQEYQQDIESKLNRQKEIEISQKQGIRKEVYSECSQIMQVLVDLANICYEEQQQEDAEQMDEHFLEDQLKLFMEGKPLRKEKILEQEGTIDSLAKQEGNQQDSKYYLADKELQDFLQGKGDWVPQQKLEVNQISGSASVVGSNPGNLGAPVAVKIHNNDSQTALEELKINTSEPLSNYYLGDVVLELLKEHFKEEIQAAQKEKINNLDWIPLKMAIIGYQFSGKKTLASCVERKYNIKLIQVDALLNNLLSQWSQFCKQQKPQTARTNNLQTGLPPRSQQTDRNYNASDRNLNDRIANSSHNLNSQRGGGSRQSASRSKDLDGTEEIIEMDDQTQDLAKNIEDCLLKGKDLPDEVYIRLIMREVKAIMPPLDPEEFLKELKTKELPPLSELEARVKNLALIPDLQLPPTKEDYFRKALVNKSHKYTSGIVLLDFPHTYEQSKLLEAELSGFLPHDERTVSAFDESVAKAQLIVKPTEQEKKPLDVIKPGLDLVINVQITKNESLRRALGRRFDPASKQNFHLDDNPPPVDNAPLMERLEQVREYGTSELAIVDKNCELDNNMKDLKQWYSMFGHKYQQGQIVSIPEGIRLSTAELAAQQEEEELEAIEEQQRLEEQQKLEAELSVGDEGMQLEQKQHQSQGNIPKELSQPTLTVPAAQTDALKVPSNRNIIPSSSSLHSKPEEGQMHQEAIPKVENVPKYENQLAWQELNGQLKTDEVFYCADRLIEKVLKIKELKYDTLQKNLDAVEEQKRLDLEIARIKEENDGKWLFSTREEISNDLANAASSMKIEPTALQNLVNLWGNTQDQYLENMRITLFHLNEQKQVILLFFHTIQKRFLEMIVKNDAKFLHMRKYQEDYNDFVEKNPDMCEEDGTKEELHQRVEDLHDLLYDIIEAKKEEATEERNQIIKSQWIEREMERFTLLIQKLLQCELGRSFMCQQLISDYYALLQGNEIAEVPEYIKADIVLNQDTLPAVEENGAFLRLEKIAELALKLHAGEEEVEEKGGAKKGGKQPPVKKEDKKAAKKGGKGAVEEVEEKKELTVYEKRSRDGVNLEKIVFKQRVQLIKDYATSKLKEMRAFASLLFGKLQDWIDFSFLTENQAVNEMDMIFRHYIEQQAKIQQEIQLNYVDVVISHQTLNFLTPPPIILPAKEVIYSNKFTISQLYIIIEELKSITNDQNFIESRALLQLLTRKTTSKLSKKDIPDQWRTNTIKEYQNLIERLDPEQIGYVNSKDICSYLCLYGSSIPTVQEEDEYYQNLKESQGHQDTMLRTSFIQASAWFDVQESSKLELNTNLFDRPKYIKELLFYIHKDPESDIIDIDSYLHSVSAQSYLQKLAINSEIRSFAELLFG